MASFGTLAFHWSTVALLTLLLHTSSFLTDAKVQRLRAHVAKSMDSELGGKKNVLGTALQSCSKNGMAMTGFTRNGKCADVGDDDAGSHHICIIMKSDFCTVTGQPNWCEEEMPCMGKSGDCKIGNWCVCQWAFASYLEMAGGCDSATVNVLCNSTNMAAARAYKESSESHHVAALQCIEQQCGAIPL
mmetsp:Transcript_4344/g.7237  ORF Transcript_4344/g.7237 Transcript_4344/m.7237 type:complete len:188 (+) Transcript_4344:68-631(+)